MRASPGRDAVGHFAGPEGGAHQSVATPLIGIGQPELLSFEPAYADELAEIRGSRSATCKATTAARSICGCRRRTVEQPGADDRG